MRFPVYYDTTRLGSRLFHPSPNGLHRVDAALARFFLDSEGGEAIWYPWPLSHRLVSAKGAKEILDAVDAHFHEEESAAAEPMYEAIKAWVLDETSAAAAPETASRIRLGRRAPLARMASWAMRHGLGARPAARTLPRGARYFNASYYGLASRGAFDWMRQRPDVRPVFFIHDMLPLETPEYFLEAEVERHRRRMHALAAHGAAAIVSTEVVKTSLLAHMTSLGRPDLPVFVSPPPTPSVFFDAPAVDAELAARPYFVQCGTIEPRKNHLLMLQVWRELIARQGAKAPKLILVGKRGWKNEYVIDVLERSPALRRHVLEASGVPTPLLARLLKNSRALLMPSFAEGFGLPLVEALAAGVPAVASDIPVFHEVAGGRFTALSPIDGAGWLEAVTRLSETEAAHAPSVPVRGHIGAGLDDLADFVDSL